MPRKTKMLSLISTKVFMGGRTRRAILFLKCDRWFPVYVARRLHRIGGERHELGKSRQIRKKGAEMCDLLASVLFRQMVGDTDKRLGVFVSETSNVNLGSSSTRRFSYTMLSLEPMNPK